MIAADRRPSYRHFGTQIRNPAQGAETEALLVEVRTQRLRGFTTLSSDEMRLAGYPDSTTEIDVCEGIK